MKPIVVSIVIPTLNEEKFLPRLLSDLNKQKSDHFEVIIVDGRSRDKTKKVVEAFLHHFPLQFITVEKRNVAFQKNYGATKAVGSHIVFLDADVRVGPTFISKLNKSFNRWHCLVYLFTIYPVESFFQDKMFFSTFNFLVDLSQKTSKPLSIGMMVFHRDYFHYLGGFNEKLFLGEDVDIIRRARKYGVITKVLKEVKIRVSMRRFKHEGYLKTLGKYLITTMRTIHSSGIEKRIFEYKMGGGHYRKSNKKAKSLDREIIDYLRQIKKRLDQ